MTNRRQFNKSLFAAAVAVPFMSGIAFAEEKDADIWHRVTLPEVHKAGELLYDFKNDGLPRTGELYNIGIRAALSTAIIRHKFLFLTVKEYEIKYRYTRMGVIEPRFMAYGLPSLYLLQMPHRVEVQMNDGCVISLKNTQKLRSI